MYTVIVDKADLAKFGSMLGDIGPRHIPVLKVERDAGSKGKKRIVTEFMPRTLWIVIHGNEFLAAWVAGNAVTNESIFPLERLGTFLEEMRSGRGIG